MIENTGEAITIANPEAAGSLLDLAKRAQATKRRILFFCACSYQTQDGEPFCHRYEVGSLLLNQSRKRNRWIVVTEWPGTEPQVLRLSLPSEILKKLRGGMKSIPLPNDKPLDSIAFITWGSVVHGSSDGEPFDARVDPAKWSTNGWYLPVLDPLDEKDGVASNREKKTWGFFDRRTEA